MLTALCNGGLASQLNKYVIAYQLSEYLNTDLCLNLSSYYSGYFRPYVLSYFKIPYCYYCDSDLYSHICKNSFKIHSSKDMNFLLNSGNKYNYNIVDEDIYYKDFLIKHPEFDANENSNIIKNLKLKNRSNFFDLFIEKINNQDSVAVHIRRGDFVSLKWDDDIDYYKSSIGHMLKLYPNAHFYFFSNDLRWVYSKFGTNSRFHYIMPINGYLGDVEEFFCMSKCKYRILSIQSGFGKLSNIVSIAKGDGEFALYKKCRAISGYELLNKTIQYEENSGNKYSVFLSDEELNIGLKYFNSNIDIKYNNFFNECNLDEVVTNNELDKYLLSDADISCNSMVDLYNKRIDLSIKEGNMDRCKDCMETLVGIDKSAIEKYNELWQKRYYFIKNENQKQISGHIVKINVENEKWIIDGVLRLIMILNRLGCKIVVTDNLNNPSIELKNVDKQKLNILYVGKLIPNIDVSVSSFRLKIVHSIYTFIRSILAKLFQNFIKFILIHNYINKSFIVKDMHNIDTPFSIIDEVDINTYFNYKNILMLS